eukprot:1377294-Rhodomonas_salina.1
MEVSRAVLWLPCSFATSPAPSSSVTTRACGLPDPTEEREGRAGGRELGGSCLLYTSDAADDM